MSPLRPRPAGRRSIALLSTLAILVLVTILSVGMTLLMMHEGSAARGHRNRQAALQASDSALAAAISTLRDAIGTNAFWASQPGRLVVFNADGTVSSNIDLFTAVAANGTVDLNQKSWSGAYPVGGAMTKAMPLGWMNQLRDPSAAAASNNAVVARYAWWIDDESSRVNVNTADGTARGAAASLGEGYPTEVSLGALGGTISNQAAAIAALARTNGLGSEAELARVSGVVSSEIDSNRFNLTAFSRSQEMNLFGEPKIYLMGVAQPPAVNPGLTRTSYMVGPYGSLTANTSAGAPDSTMPPGMPVTQVYPDATQLPGFVWASGMLGPAPPGTLALPQYPYVAGQPWETPAGAETNAPNYLLASRIAQYLGGYDSQGKAITWPTFPGSGSTGFTGKYTARQIDSIALQIVNLAGDGLMADGSRNHTIPYIVAKGPLSGQPVTGLGRGPRLVQVVFQIQPLNSSMTAPPGYDNAGQSYNVLIFKIEVDLEWYFPPQFQGAPLSAPNTSWGEYNGGGSGNFQCLNWQDLPSFTVSAQGVPTGLAVPYVASPLSTSGASSPTFRANSFWGDNLLRFTVAAGTDPATGLSLVGQDAGVDLVGNNPSQVDPDSRAVAMHPWSVKAGKAAGTGLNAGAVTPALQISFPAGGPGATGAWQPGERHASRSLNAVSGTQAWPTRPGVTAVNIDGGLAVWANNGEGSDPAYTMFNPVPFDSLHGTRAFGETLNATTGQMELAAVIPIHIANLAANKKTVVHLWVSDPFVNLFPADWTNNPNDGSATAVQGYITSGNSVGTTTTAYPGYAKPGGDQGALWMPPQDGTIPQSRRFPNAGLLQFVHTGMFPDVNQEPANPGSPADPKIATEHGTPWRIFSMAPSGSAGQATDGGGNYPDWAMLDLFTVPAMPQPAGTTTYRDLTYGGATSGRLNPNGVAIQPASWSATRLAPMTAAFQGLSTVTTGGVTNAPLASSDAAKIAAGISAYLAANGAGVFRTPGEIANVPEVAAYLTANGLSGNTYFRNDAARQAVGLLSTRSNVFSVWVVGQSVQKVKGNTSYGSVEATDQITDEIRMRYVVERYLDPGPSGAEDAVQPVAGAPSNPAYKYRVVYAEQLDN